MNYYTPLFTDYYQLTMAYGYWQLQRAETEAVFQLTFRKNPFQGNYTVTCGLANVIDYLQNFRFRAEDIAYLQSLKRPDQQAVFSLEFLQYLSQLHFSCDVDAIAEGNLIFPQEPLLRITGPLLQCQLLETPLLNLMNFSSLIATRAAQVCHITGYDTVMEFGLRRAQGPDGALTASRAAYIGGCESTSNVLAGKTYNIPVKGTMAHSWIMSYPDELTAFREFVKISPLSILLVDTYDSLHGIKNAIQVGKELQQQGRDLMAIRLDSGDLLELSRAARKLLNEAGFVHTKIIASGDLTAEKIKQLKLAKAPIDLWGIGTKLVTGYEQPSLDAIYKLTAIRDESGVFKYKAKQSDSPNKKTYPGIHQVRRYFNNDQMQQDLIYDIHTQPWDKQTIAATAEKDLLLPIFRRGKLVYQSPSIHTIRETCINEMKKFSLNTHDSYSTTMQLI